MADFLGIALLSAVTLPALGRLVALDRDLLLAHLTADLLLRDGQLAQARSLGTARLYSIEVLHESYGDSKYRPCPLLKKMVDAGLHGRESGRRFYAHLAATAQEGGGIGNHDRFGDHGDRLFVLAKTAAA